MIGQMTKRIFLFVLVNVLVTVTITAILAVFHVGRYLPAGGLAELAVFCLVWGFGGSLLLTRVFSLSLLYSADRGPGEKGSGR